MKMSELLLFLFFFIIGIVYVRGSEVQDELYQASYIGDVSRVEYLLGLDQEILSSRPPVFVNRVNENFGRTAMMVCGLDPQKDQKQIDAECTKIVRMIHMHGGNLNITDNFGWDVLSLASFRGLTKVATYILKSHEVPVDRLDNEGRSSLMKAAANGYQLTFQALLKYGADLKLQDLQGRTCLHYVVLFAIKDHESGIPFLKNSLTMIPSGTGIFEFVDNDKRNILMYASIANDVSVVQCIIDYLESIDDNLQSSISKLDHKDAYGMSASAMTSSQLVKEILTAFEINMVLKQHEKWKANQEKVLKDDSL
jgi:hypothetical protein